MSELFPPPPTLRDHAIALALALLLLVPAVFCHGYVLSRLWDWFVVPASPLALPHLSIPVAMGLSLFSRYLLGLETETDRPEDEAFWVWVAKLCLKPFVTAGGALLFGWVLLKFI